MGLHVNFKRPLLGQKNTYFETAYLNGLVERLCCQRFPEN